MNDGIFNLKVMEQINFDFVLNLTMNIRNRWFFNIIADSVRLDPTLGKHICDKQDEVNQFLKDQMLNNFSEQLYILFSFTLFYFIFLLNAKKECHSLHQVKCLISVRIWFDPQLLLIQVKSRPSSSKTQVSPVIRTDLALSCRLFFQLTGRLTEGFRSVRITWIMISALSICGRRN
jgi:hypothetical protein